MAIIKKSKDRRPWQACKEKGIPVHCWWECKLVQLLLRTVWRFFKNLKIEVPYSSVIPLLCIYLNDKKSIFYRGICKPIFITALFTVGKTGKKPVIDR